MFACSVHSSQRSGVNSLRWKWMVTFRLLLCLLTLAAKHISNCNNITMIILTAIDCTDSHWGQARVNCHPPESIQQVFFLRTVKWMVSPKRYFGVPCIKKRKSKYYNPVLVIGKGLLLSLCILTWVRHILMYIFMCCPFIHLIHTCCILIIR